MEQSRRDQQDPGIGRRRAGLALMLLIAVAAGCGGSEPGTDRAPPQESPAVDADTPAGDADTLVGETETPTDDAGRPAPEPGTYVYTCSDGFAFAARIRQDTAIVELVNRDVTLPRTPADSGGTYEGDDVVFRTRGSEGMLVDGDSEHRDCTGTEASSPWEKARMLGIELRALGQEPGWIVDVNPGDWIRYNGDYGETRLVFPPAAPTRDSTGVTYRTSTDDHALTVEFRRTTCHDAMSGRPFAYTVRLEVDGRSLAGCGRRLREP